MPEYASNESVENLVDELFSQFDSPEATNSTPTEKVVESAPLSTDYAALLPVTSGFETPILSECDIPLPPLPGEENPVDDVVLDLPSDGRAPRDDDQFSVDEAAQNSRDNTSDDTANAPSHTVQKPLADDLLSDAEDVGETSFLHKLGLWWNNLSKVARGLIVVFILVIPLLIALVIFGGGSKKDAPTPVITPAATTSAAPVETPSPHLLTPSSVVANCPAGISTKPDAALTGDKDKAWICTRKYGMDGVILTINFPAPVTVTSVQMVPGYDYVTPDVGVDNWLKYRVVTKSLWRVGDKQYPLNFTVQDRQGATLTMPNIVTQKIVITIQETKRPDQYTGITDKEDAFAVGNIAIIGLENTSAAPSTPTTPTKS